MTGPRSVAWVMAAILLGQSSEVAAQVVQLRASDGTPIAATLYPAAGGPAPAVVLVHMLTRTRDDWRGFATRLQAAGATCLALDLRGHGGSGGAAAPSAAMALDVQAAVMWLTARSDVRTSAIALVGASFGATAALLAAGELPVGEGGSARLAGRRLPRRAPGPRPPQVRRRARCCWSPAPRILTPCAPCGP